MGIGFPAVCHLNRHELHMISHLSAGWDIYEQGRSRAGHVVVTRWAPTSRGPHSEITNVRLHSAPAREVREGLTSGGERGGGSPHRSLKRCRVSSMTAPGQCQSVCLSVGGRNLRRQRGGWYGPNKAAVCSRLQPIAEGENGPQIQYNRAG